MIDLTPQENDLLHYGRDNDDDINIAIKMGKGEIPRTIYIDELRILQKLLGHGVISTGRFIEIINMKAYHYAKKTQ